MNEKHEKNKTLFLANFVRPIGLNGHYGRRGRLVRTRDLRGFALMSVKSVPSVRSVEQKSLNKIHGFYKKSLKKIRHWNNPKMHQPQFHRKIDSNETSGTMPVIEFELPASW